MVISSQLPLLLLAAWVIYATSLAIYRLCLSPIAKFPGPKLAALTKWYEAYYDIVYKNGGQFSFKVQEMHRRYGPIVRINPTELHVSDAEYFEELYTKNPKADKLEWMAYRFGIPSNTFATVPHELHRLRRAALNPMFSKRAIMKYEPVIREKLALLCKQIADYNATGKIVMLHNGYTAFIGDVTMEYAFGFCYDKLKSPGFKDSMHEAFLAANRFGHVQTHFPFFLPDLVALCTRLTRGEDLSSKPVSHPTVMYEVLASTLPQTEKTIIRLVDESATVVGAGIMTTAWVLSVTTFHVTNNASIQHKLRNELEAALPDPTQPLDWVKLEQLPYLAACVKEGLRLGFGVATRMPRLAEDATRYKEWVIPPRTPVSMALLDLMLDESVFADPHAFVPERWLGNPKTASGEPLEHYLHPFGGGSRICLGLNLAYAEIYLGLAAIFRRFTFELYETDESDFHIQYDFFMPIAKLDSKGLRVTVTSDVLGG
ncbi:trichodiene oxygenase [Mytilinidion resinicola]|uniref:Trichodiene oxygenase n=1 Tax=Mytilinidion resinicola TaxID=574789 RepID=A0A6A6YIE9_9PEZI|nr:trichodiene oxygenase [Mytilinidion resinicola]KAF2807697.1 trichodiene oxygenase [Mytilinidion resinicola]